MQVRDGDVRLVLEWVVLLSGEFPLPHWCGSLRRPWVCPDGWRHDAKQCTRLAAHRFVMCLGRCDPASDACTVGPCVFSDGSDINPATCTCGSNTHGDDGLFCFAGEQMNAANPAQQLMVQKQTLDRMCGSEYCTESNGLACTASRTSVERNLFVRVLTLEDQF